MADSPPIEVDGLSVCYRVPRERVASFKEFAIRWLQRQVTYTQHWGLRQVSFTVNKGEILGVVGRNGAGKSTLLKVLAKVLHPTEGKVIVRGVVSPLLEIGAGFHAELTGRENVYLYGALLGYGRRAIEDRFQAIVDFAELWDFIDAPLRVYSSGMISRLGFAVATADYADVFLIDEVLAVGDSWFQQKCIHRLLEYQMDGASVVLVSHDPGIVRRLCSRSLWIDGGRIRALGPTEEVLSSHGTGEQHFVNEIASGQSLGATIHPA